MKAMFDDIKRFVREEDGAAGVEYALLLCLVAVVIATFVAALSGDVRTIFNAIQTGLNAGAAAVG
ncbi:MAG: Flp family type IVb pilin [Cupriavidus sp.]|nr:Flp family type IVb pilin [Cupriavidus sp.]